MKYYLRISHFQYCIYFNYLLVDDLFKTNKTSLPKMGNGTNNKTKSIYTIKKEIAICFIIFEFLGLLLDEQYLK